MRANGPQPRLHRFTLPNGLRVILDCRFPQPRVAVAVHHGTGFRSEPPGREGFAHLFEHLMFRGSASLPDGRYYDHVHRFGARANGTTHQDYTDYYQVVPAQALERALFAEADRMRAPLFTETALAEQLDGVAQEIHQAVHARPYGGFPWPLMPGALFRTFANAHDGYGDADRLRTTTVADCAEFFAAHYVPGNAVLTVVGAADPEATRALVERHFAGIPPRPLAPGPVLTEPRPTEERWVECSEPGITATALATGHRLPDPAADLPAYLAHAVLARLTAEQGPPAPGLSPVSTSCGFFGPLDAKDPDALMVTALLPHDADPKQAAAAITRRWSDWAERPPAEAVRRTVRLMTAEHHRDHGDLQTRCRALGRLEILFGRADLLDLLPEHLAAIGPAEVAHAAKELAQGPVTGLVLRPGPGRTRPEVSFADGDTERRAAGGSSPAEDMPEPRPLPPYGPPFVPEPAPLCATTLDDGLRVVALADHRAPSVEVRLRLPLGPYGWREPAGAEALLRRALARTRAVDRAAALGGSLSAGTDGQWLDVTGAVPPRELAVWLAVLAELTAPHEPFPALPDGHRLARPTPQRLMDDAVRRHWLADAAAGEARPWERRGGVLVLLGDVDPERAASLARDALSGRPSVPPRPAETDRQHPLGGGLLVLRAPSEPALHLTLCAPEPPAGSGDAETTEAARYLATAAFGGYFGSRLAARLRRVTGAGYEAYSGRDVALEIPRVFVRARVAPHLADETLAGIREELRRAGVEPFGEAEVAAAREFCAAQALGAFDSPAGQADLLRQLTAAGRDPHWLPRLPRLLREVPAHEVARAGAELFAAAEMDTVLFGNLAADRARELVPTPAGHG
ncbi:insulinase family protein [Streptomyces sp. NPDC046915]|uniref:M16 family metallopeptidase n=1 Tax=Streptomyces sp. NPDC046915 TaxID=3155257 RepID=UPI0034024D9D